MSSRTPMIAGNWKMNKPGSKATDAACRLKDLVKTATDLEIMIAPPFTALYQVAQVIRGSGIALGAQNLHWEKQGAFTVEISTEMLVDAGCSHVIIGHSERRQFFGETDSTVNRKIQAALLATLTPVLCIGETEAQRLAGETFSVLDKQVRDGLKDFAFSDIGDLIIAYEPVWAIGTGKTSEINHGQTLKNDEIDNNTSFLSNEDGSTDREIILFLLSLFIITYIVLVICGRPVPDSLNTHIDAIISFIIGFLSGSPRKKKRPHKK